ncbi:hypothetical protein AcV5_001381 [Taiwanofungus camphoratus]|nr:hypothetical protein AcW2_005992 [Antrodia cinnamomea]KAI0940210.1 hypothetical protein AcV5_001381 [Antrodia cinnamomea]
MSRSDAHLHEYEHSVPDARPSGEHGQSPREHGSHLRDFSARDSLRDSTRDFSSRELLPPTYYQSPTSFAADRRSLTSAALAGSGGLSGSSGYSSFMSPRMFNSPQGIGDSWSPRPATHAATPNVTRQSADGGSVPSQVQLPSVPSLVHNHHHASSPTRGPSVAKLYNSPLLANIPGFSDRDVRDARDLYLNHRQLAQPTSPSVPLPHAHPQSLPSPTASSAASARSTLWWGELEPWMDEEYAKQVCTLMGWDPVSIKVPRPAPDPITGQQANNPGYCFLTFPSQAHAASVLSQINNSNSGNGAPAIMPNSSKPFSLNWASSVSSAPVTTVLPGQTVSLPSGQNPQYPKEYSIFVGDLAPEVSNSDLVAVFRNPVLGLRNDREPRFIRPFLSCKSAKIMLDPVTGVSRGYGFVRFTDEADQQRALIEMHGLYCLSRPMRISPATAKFKPAPGMGGIDFSQMQFPLVTPPMPPAPEPQTSVTIALPLPNASQTKSVSAPLAGSAAALTNGNTVSNSTSNSSLTAPSLASGSSSASSSSTLASTASDEALKAAQFASGGGSSATTSSSNGGAPSGSAPYAQPAQEQTMAQRYNISEESWKHHAQARAILSNLIGPNGEQLTSSDPYNTTVFVGGLSPLISEETLRTFFAPFGDIHYVKVPVGKHCGFVQFVRKPDAERAIEKMQGFPIGGSRIRLSWGRSQYKAAQAAAQAAQAAAFQAQYQTQVQTPAAPSLTPEQALQLLEKFGLTNILNNGGAANNVFNAFNGNPSIFGPRPGSSSSVPASSFSPFSPDPNYLADSMKTHESAPSNQAQSIPGLSKGYASWYNPAQDEKVASGSGKVSPVQTIRPPSASQRFGSLLGEASSSASPFQPNRAASRQEAPIARPDVSRNSSQNQDQYAGHGHEQDLIQDLNGTLASLDLDSQGMWKNGDSVGAHTLPASPS